MWTRLYMLEKKRWMAPKFTDMVRKNLDKEYSGCTCISLKLNLLEASVATKGQSSSVGVVERGRKKW